LYYSYSAERVGSTRIQPAPTRSRGGLEAGFASKNPTWAPRIKSKNRTDPNLGLKGSAGRDLPPILYRVWRQEPARVQFSSQRIRPG